MKKQLIIATLALTLVAGASVVSFAEEGVATTTTTSTAVEEKTEFYRFGGMGKGGNYGFNRITDEEREARRAECATLTEEERAEFYAKRDAERATRRGAGCAALTDEEREARRAECANLTDEERAELFAKRDAERAERRAQRPFRVAEDSEEFTA